MGNQSSIFIQVEDGTIEVKGKGEFVHNAYGALNNVLANTVPTALKAGGSFEFRYAKPEAQPGSALPSAETKNDASPLGQPSAPTITKLK